MLGWRSPVWSVAACLSHEKRVSFSLPILPKGVQIGASVIGGGSVVTKRFLRNVMAAGTVRHVSRWLPAEEVLR